MPGNWRGPSIPGPGPWDRWGAKTGRRLGRRLGHRRRLRWRSRRWPPSKRPPRGRPGIRHRPVPSDRCRPLRSRKFQTKRHRHRHHRRQSPSQRGVEHQHRNPSPRSPVADVPCSSESGTGSRSCGPASSRWPTPQRRLPAWPFAHTRPRHRHRHRPRPRPRHCHCHRRIRHHGGLGLPPLGNGGPRRGHQNGVRLGAFRREALLLLLLLLL
mmetsp:Transcript_4991/g.14469  ORF Transcript_4991/g.14469 Transcript_4991/m.14469 type:complete len:212 (-) Transcript_4991:311-946(-)